MAPSVNMFRDHNSSYMLLLGCLAARLLMLNVADRQLCVRFIVQLSVNKIWRFPEMEVPPKSSKSSDHSSTESHDLEITPFSETLPNTAIFFQSQGVFPGRSRYRSQHQHQLHQHQLHQHQLHQHQLTRRSHGSHGIGIAHTRRGPSIVFNPSDWYQGGHCRTCQSYGMPHMPQRPDPQAAKLNLTWIHNKRWCWWYRKSCLTIVGLCLEIPKQ